MKQVFFLLLLSAIFFACNSKERSGEVDFTVFADSAWQIAVKQYKQMNAVVPDTLFPRSTRPDGTLWTNRSDWWTSGFFSGSLWYLYEYSNDPVIKQMAEARTYAVEREKSNIGDHDIGFKMYCSYGNKLRLTGDTSCINVLLTSAKSLTMRFDSTVGCIRSWGKISDHKKPFLVIIDNMMNLELLYWATKQSGDSLFYKIATTHADNTLKNHFRADGSSYHVLEYNPVDGTVLKKRTDQGYADESAWARGQAWGLYGYTVTYRETGDKRYLDQAQKIAHFILHHPNLPKDKIPYWDFNAPNIPNAYRDVSAGAIMASALLELSTLCDQKSNDLYRTTAKQMLVSLSQEPYLAKPGENNNFILRHSVGNLPKKSEIDVPLSYADYYYLEALTRLRKLEGK